MKDRDQQSSGRTKQFFKTVTELKRSCLDETAQALQLCKEAQRLRQDVTKVRQEVIRELGRGGPKLVQPD